MADTSSDNWEQKPYFPMYKKANWFADGKDDLVLPDDYYSSKYLVDMMIEFIESEGELDKRIYRPGDCHVLPAGTAEGYRMPDRCYALEYARGNIPAMLPFGFADGLTSTLDVSALPRTAGVYTKAVLGNLARGKV